MAIRERQRACHRAWYSRPGAGILRCRIERTGRTVGPFVRRDIEGSPGPDSGLRLPIPRLPEYDDRRGWLFGSSKPRRKELDAALAQRLGMIKSLKVTGLNRCMSFDLKFHEDINIVTGRNGSGKTTVLKLLWYAISGNLERIIAEIRFESFRSGDRQDLRRHDEGDQTEVRDHEGQLPDRRGRAEVDREAQ